MAEIKDINTGNHVGKACGSAICPPDAPEDVRLSEHPTDEEIQNFFKDDTFAYVQAGCRITESWKGHGKAEMELDPCRHCNAQGYVMGGAVFTLADYAVAAASVPGYRSSVSLMSTIEFVHATRGNKLIATCDADHSGNKVGFYTVNVVDDEDTLIARVLVSCYHPV